MLNFGKKTKTDFGGSSRIKTIGDIVARQYGCLTTMGEQTKSLLGKAFLSTESLTEQDQNVLEEGVTGIDNALTSIQTDVQEQYTDEPLTDEEMEDITDSMVIASNPEAYIESSARQAGDQSIVSSLGGDPEVEPVSSELSRESFESHGMMNTLAITVSYNIRAEKQSKAAELFFPTISLDSTQNNYTIDLHISTVFKEQLHEISGNQDPFRHQKNIIKALRNHEILKSGYTDLVPVYRTENADKFVDITKLPLREYINDHDEKIKTTLLKIGEQVNLIGISQSDYVVLKGLRDTTDQISANPRLNTLGVQFNKDKVILFENLKYHRSSTFTYRPTEDSQGVELNYNSSTHVLSENTKCINAKGEEEDISGLTDVLKTNKIEILINLGVTGEGSTDYGTFTLNGKKVSINTIRDSETKQVIPLDDTKHSAAVTAAKGIVEKLEIVGYEIDASLTNSNIREHGMLLDDRSQRIIYGIKLHSPIAIRRPVNDKSTSAQSSDSQRMDSLIKSTFIRRTNAAITAIYDILAMLKAQPKNLDMTEPYSHSVIGIGQYFARTYVNDFTVDIMDFVQSLSNTDRLANVSAVLTNILLTEATQAYTSSELAAAYEITDMGGSAFRPHIIAIADVFTSKFIFRQGDSRTLGDGFDFSIEECSDNRLVDGNLDGDVGTIFMSFGRPKQGSLSVPLWFGNCLDKREIPRIITRARGEKVQHEVMVQPWFSHICHLPILVRIRVRGLKRAVQERTPFAVATIENKKPEA